jgi:hypothetical protein
MLSGMTSMFGGGEEEGDKTEEFEIAGGRVG